MRSPREFTWVAYAVPISSVLGIVMSAVNAQLFEAPLFSAICAPFALYICASYRNISRANAAAREKGELIECISKAVFFRSKGISLPRVIERVSNEASSARVATALKCAAKRMRMGEGIREAFEGSELTRRVFAGETITGSGFEALERLLNAHRHREAERLVRVEASMQRYATVNMFLTTVLPSFVTFAFIGSMIIAQRTASMFAISVALLLVIPAAYATICLVQKGREHD